METKFFVLGFVALIGVLMLGWIIQLSPATETTQATSQLPSEQTTPQTPVQVPNTESEEETDDEDDLGSIIPNEPTTPATTPTPATPTTPTKPVTPTPSGITAAELAQHNQRSDCWVGYKGQAYDVTAFLPRHPGGVSRILAYCGTTEEFTAAFNKQHKTKQDARLARDAPVMGDLA